MFWFLMAHKIDEVGIRVKDLGEEICSERLCDEFFDQFRLKGITLQNRATLLCDGSLHKK